MKTITTANMLAERHREHLVSFVKIYVKPLPYPHDGKYNMAIRLLSEAAQIEGKVESLETELQRLQSIIREHIETATGDMAGVGYE